MIQKRNYRQYISIFLMLFVYNLHAQIGTPANPTFDQVQSSAASSYYNQLVGLSGNDLRNALQNIVVNSNTRGQTYGDAWLMLREADENPANTDQVWQVYIEEGINKSEQNTGGSTGWNREHVFPQTRGGFSGGTSTSSDGKDVYFSTSADDIAHAHGDVHHLRASFVGENSNRGSLDFANVSGPRTKDTYFYEPPLSAKGDVARSLFYMAVRYNALSLAAGDQDGQVIGDLTALLAWHKLDVTDDFEMNRNNVVFDWQYNRNPFIDMPDLVDYLWGDKQGQAWPGNGTVYIVLGSVNAFPLTSYGAISATQSYTVEGTELGAILNIDAPLHFEISLNDIDYVKYIELNTTAGALSATTVYLRFKPESAVGGEINAFINHYSDTKTAKLSVSGTEGNPSLVPVEIYVQDFETNCAPDWVIYSVSSNEDWTCDIFGHNGGVAIAMNNYEADTDSEDWLISPLLDVTGYSQPNFKYWMEWDYTGSTVELLYSTNYSGTGDPSSSTWTKVDDVMNQDNWTEYISDLQGIAASSFYLAFKHTSGSTSGFSSRINLDDISLTGIAATPSISTSTANLNFAYTAANSTSATQNYTITAVNLEADVNLLTETPFEISLDETVWSTSLTVLQAEASNKVVYVRLKPTVSYLAEQNIKITHSSTSATNIIVDLIAAANSDIPTDASSLARDKTLDVVTWNLEWFGESNKSDPDWPAKLASVASTMLDLDADIYALQEVIVDGVNGDYLTPLVDELNSQAGAGTYASVYGPRYSLDNLTPTADWPAQRVCYVYRTATLASGITNSESMFSALYDENTTTITGYTGDASLFWASGRLPFLLEADVTIDGVTIPFSFINIHAKCCSDSKDRKVADALFLKAELDNTFDTDNVIVLGDYNDYYEGSMSGGDSPYITWFENTNEDYLRGAGASIDHISVSNELYYEYQALTNNASVGTTDASDHDPILLRLILDDANFEGQVIVLDNVVDRQMGDEAFTVHAESSKNLTIQYEIVSGPATIIGNVLSITGSGTVSLRAFNNGNDNILAAEDVLQFNVSKASQTITFNLAAEIDLSEGNISLSASSSSGLLVSFRVISGSGTVSGNVLSFTQVGDIVVEAYQDGNDNYNAATAQKTILVVDAATSILDIPKLQFSIYPNPSNGIINIEHDFVDKNALVKIYSSTGLLIESHKLIHNLELDISHLNSGVYIISVESDEQVSSKTIILK